jgi:hypothetical protein
MEKENIEYVDITPHKSILPKMGQAGYSVAQAIAELIDNSIDAKTESKLVINITLKDGLIQIEDNASGMNKLELAKAFSLAHSSKKNKLGEFGLGLKTSCQSLGRQFNIKTSREGDSNWFKIEYDEEDWLNSEKNNWTSYPIKISKKDDLNEHGTFITISKLKIRADKAIDSVRKDVGNRFSPFIQRGEVDIKVNGKQNKPFVPDLLEHTKKEFEIKLGENRVHGWYGLMKEGSPKGYYGFTVFRRGRMITYYDKIGIPEHATIARITGEIHMDHVPVTHNKREFIKDSNEYLEAEEALNKEFKDVVREARKKANDDKITSNVKQEVNIWKDKIADALKTDVLKELVEPNLEEKRASQKNNEKDNVDIEKRDRLNLSTIPQDIKEDQKATPNIRKPKKLHNKRHTIKIKGKRFDFNIEYYNLGPNSSWKNYTISEKDGMLEIIINVDFPAWLTTKDTPFYVVMLVAEAISEILCKQFGEVNHEKIQEIKEEILRRASELKNDFEEEVEDIKDNFRVATSFLPK